MAPERQRLIRLQRLEKLRAIAKQAAATEAARAETTLAQLDALAARTAQLAQDYSHRDAAGDGLELSYQAAFSAGLAAIYTSTTIDADRARTIADGRQTELARAERQRAAVDERAVRQLRSIASRSAAPN